MIKINITNGQVSGIESDSAEDAARVIAALGTKAPAVHGHNLGKKYRKVRKISSDHKGHWWTPSEMSFIAAHLDKMTNEELSNDPALTKRHTPTAIAFLVAQIRNGKFYSKRTNRLYSAAQKEGSSFVAEASPVEATAEHTFTEA